MAQNKSFCSGSQLEVKVKAYAMWSFNLVPGEEAIVNT